MTREEAIDILKCGRPFDDNPKEDLDEFNLALGVAIKALKNENALLDCVLDIIDAEAWSYCDYIMNHNGNVEKMATAQHLSENIREAVKALKGEQK